jgi:hypothetical protein
MGDMQKQIRSLHCHKKSRKYKFREEVQTHTTYSTKTKNLFEICPKNQLVIEIEDNEFRIRSQKLKLKAIITEKNWTERHNSTLSR